MAMVCRQWRRTAAQPMLWRRVYFGREVAITATGLPAAAQRLRSMGVRQLNICDLHMQDSVHGRSYHLCPARLAFLISRLSTSLVELYLPTIADPSVVDLLVSHVPRLRVLYVARVTLPVDLGKLGELRCLQTLFVDASGIAPVPFAFSGGLDNLRSLVCLKHLELVHLRHELDDFSFLTALPALRTLSLGLDPSAMTLLSSHLVFLKVGGPGERELPHIAVLSNMST